MLLSSSTFLCASMTFIQLSSFLAFFQAAEVSSQKGKLLWLLSLADIEIFGLAGSFHFQTAPAPPPPPSLALLSPGVSKRKVFFSGPSYKRL